MSLEFSMNNFPVDVPRLKEQGYDLVCVLGPTASGKTRFAVELALRLGSPEDPGAEIISADSRQVYTGMDIGTGKDMEEYTVDLQRFRGKEETEKGFAKAKAERSAGETVRSAAGKMIKIPCHLVDVVPAGTKYNLFEYRRDFWKVYHEIKSRGKMPVLCGGSGLYIEAVTRNYNLQEVAPDLQLRVALEGKTIEELRGMLVRLKAARGEKPHNVTDFDTKKRVIRAIEIESAWAKGAGRPDSGNGTGPREEALSFSPLACKYIGIKVDRETRNRRIDKRLKQRLENGMVEEVRGLLDRGIPAEDLIYYGLEYKFITRYLLGEMKYEEMEEKLAVAIHQFAKRQMTWFRGMERRGIEIEWVDWNTENEISSPGEKLPPDDFV